MSLCLKLKFLRKKSEIQAFINDLFFGEIFFHDFEHKLSVAFAKVIFNHPKSRPSVIIIQFFFNNSVAPINKIPNFGRKSEKKIDFEVILELRV